MASKLVTQSFSTIIAGMSKAELSHAELKLINEKVLKFARPAMLEMTAQPVQITDGRYSLAKELKESSYYKQALEDDFLAHLSRCRWAVKSETGFEWQDQFDVLDHLIKTHITMLSLPISETTHAATEGIFKGSDLDNVRNYLIGSAGDAVRRVHLAYGYPSCTIPDEAIEDLVNVTIELNELGETPRSYRSALEALEELEGYRFGKPQMPHKTLKKSAKKKDATLV